MSSTFLPNMLAPLVDPKTGKIVAPWNTFFQQLVQAAPAVKAITLSPFTANVAGVVIFTGGAPVITLTRGTTNITLTGQRIIPISVGDMITWVGATTVQFLGAQV